MKPPRDNIDGVFRQARRLTQGELDDAGARVLTRLRTPNNCAEIVERAPTSMMRPRWRFASSIAVVAMALALTVVVRHRMSSSSVLGEASDSGLDRIATGEPLEAGRLLTTNTGAILA